MANLLDVIAGANPVSAAVGGVVEVIGRVIDKIIPDPAAKAAAALELAKLQQSGELQQMAMNVQLVQAQTDTNKVEAASQNFFVAGWRPAIGWICGVGLSYSFLLQPLLTWASPELGLKTPPPSLDMGTLITLLGGMLGLGGMRTYEKVQGVSSGH